MDTTKVQCRKTEAGDWVQFTSAGWTPTPWRNDAPWEYVKRWFMEQGKQAEWIREPAKLPELH